MTIEQSALVTHVHQFAGPPAVEALLSSGFTVYGHDESFQDQEKRLAFEKLHINTRALSAQKPDEIVQEALDQARNLQVLLCNNCYPAIVAPVEDKNAAGLRDSLEALVLMPFLLTGAIVPHFKEHGGRVIMINSPRAKLPVQGGSIPDAAREAGNALMRSLARELAPYNIPVNSIEPNYLASEMYYPKNKFVDDPKGREFVKTMVPAGRLGKPEEVGELVIFLATNNAPFMTGANLEFTGGWPVSPPY